MGKHSFDIIKGKEKGCKREPGYRCQSLDKVGTASKINKFSIRDLNNAKVPEEIENFLRGILIRQGINLKDTHQQNRQIADQEVTGNGILLLQIYRPGIQLRFHDPKGFLNPPKVMVHRINVCRRRCSRFSVSVRTATHKRFLEPEVAASG